MVVIIGATLIVVVGISRPVDIVELVFSVEAMSVVMTMLTFVVLVASRVLERSSEDTLLTISAVFTVRVRVLVIGVAVAVLITVVIAGLLMSISTVAQNWRLVEIIVLGLVVDLSSLVMDGSSVVDGCFMDSSHMRALVKHGGGVLDADFMVDSSLMVNGSIVLDGRLMDSSYTRALVMHRGLEVKGGVRSIVLNGRVMMRRLVVRIILTDVTIVIVHLQDEATILKVGLASHEKRRVALKAPVVTGVPVLGVKVVEVVLPAELEVLGSHVVIVDLNKVVLGFPWHMRIIDVVVPGRLVRRPEVHQKLSRHVEDVNILGTLALAYKLIVDVSDDIVRGPLDRVFHNFGAWMEASGVVVVLSAILRETVHGEGVLVD